MMKTMDIGDINISVYDNSSNLVTDILSNEIDFVLIFQSDAAALVFTNSPSTNSIASAR